MICFVFHLFHATDGPGRGRWRPPTGAQGRVGWIAGHRCAADGKRSGRAREVSCHGRAQKEDDDEERRTASDACVSLINGRHLRPLSLQRRARHIIYSSHSKTHGKRALLHRLPIVDLLNSEHSLLAVSSRWIALNSKLETFSLPLSLNECLEFDQIRKKKFLK